MVMGMKGKIFNLFSVSKLYTCYCKCLIWIIIKFKFQFSFLRLTAAVDQEGKYKFLSGISQVSSS